MTRDIKFLKNSQSSKHALIPNAFFSYIFYNPLALWVMLQVKTLPYPFLDLNLFRNHKTVFEVALMASGRPWSDAVVVEWLGWIRGSISSSQT